MFRTIYFSPDGSGGDAGGGEKDGNDGNNGQKSSDNGQNLLNDDQGLAKDGGKTLSNGGQTLSKDDGQKLVNDGQALSNDGQMLADDGKDKASTDSEAKAGAKEGGDVAADLAKLMPSEEEVNAYLEGDVKDMSAFHKNNTQKAMAVGDERKALEQEKETFYSQMEQQMNELKQMQMDLMQMTRQPAGLPGNGNRNDYSFDEANGNGGGVDARMESRLKQLEDSIGMMNLTYSDQQAHTVLSQKYGDTYDARAVQEKINKLNGPMDLNEIVFKAIAFEKNDVSAIRAKAFKDGQTAMLKKFEGIAKKRKEIAEPALKTGGGSKRAPRPKDLKEAKERGLQEMMNSGRSFFE